MLIDPLKTFENTLLYSKEDVTITDWCDRPSHSNVNLKFWKDSITQKLARFTNIVNEKNVCRTSQRLLRAIGLVKFPLKAWQENSFHAWDRLEKLFASAKKLTATPNAPDAAPFIQYE